MSAQRRALIPRILTVMAAVLIVKTTISIVLNYQDYFPIYFSSDFLRGRERDFLGVYPWPFYIHVLSGPVSLILGLFLVSERSRTALPSRHRFLGWIQVACVLLLVAPSGLWMAYWTRGGAFAAVGLAGMAIATAVCAAFGAWTARERRFAEHRRWMWRCYLLLCSAVVLRLLGGLAIEMGMTAPWVDPLAIWLSWLMPLTTFELIEKVRPKLFQKLI